MKRKKERKETNGKGTEKGRKREQGKLAIKISKSTRYLECKAL